MKKTVLAVLVVSATLSGTVQASDVIAPASNSFVESMTQQFDAAKAIKNKGDADFSALSDEEYTAALSKGEDALVKLGMSKGNAADAFNNADNVSNAFAMTGDSIAPDHFVMTHGQKVEAEENIHGSQVKRAIINRVERNEEINHGERLAGMTSQRSVYDVQQEESNAKRAQLLSNAAATAAKAGDMDKARHYLEMAKATQSSPAVVAAIAPVTMTPEERQARFDNLKMQKENQARTASQHVDPAAVAQADVDAKVFTKARFENLKMQKEMQARHSDQHVNVDQAAADSRYNSMTVDYNAIVVATHDANAKAIADEYAQVKANQQHMQEVNEQVGAGKKQHEVDRTYQQIAAKQGAELMQDNADRTAAQNGALATAREVSRTVAQQGAAQEAVNVDRTQSQVEAKEHIEGLAKKVDNVNRTHVQQVALMQAQEVSRTDGQVAALAAAEGESRTQANIDRTAGQRANPEQTAIDTANGIAANKTDIADNAAGIAANKAGVAQTTAKLDSVTYDIAGNRRAISSLATRAADTDARIAETKAEQAKTNERVSANSAAIADHENRIESLESETTSKFSSLKNKVEENRKRASAGIAGVAAMANIPQVTDTQNFSVGAGVGNTDSESALAVGMSARATENVVVKTSVSNDTQHNFVVGAGVSYGW